MKEKYFEIYRFQWYNIISLGTRLEKRDMSEQQFFDNLTSKHKILYLCGAMTFCCGVPIVCTYPS